MTTSLRNRLAGPAAAATLIATAEPGVYLCRRQGGTWHVLQNVGTAFALCTTCEAARHGRNCWALDVAAAESIRLIKEGNTMTQDETSTAIAIAQQSASVVGATVSRLAAAEHLRAWGDLVELGAIHRKTGLAPSGFDTPEKCALALLKALEIGVPLTTAYQFFYVTNGKVGIMAELIRGLVEAKCRDEHGYIHVESSNALGATCVGYRDGRKPVRVTFTVEDAKRAGIFKGNWTQYPEDHCVAKASARIGRRMFADVLGGLPVMDRGGAIVDTGIPEEDEPGGYGGGTYEVIDVTPTVVTVDTSTGEVAEKPASATKTEPAFWAPMEARRRSLLLTEAHVAKFMGQAYGPDGVRDYCRSHGLRPAELLDRVADAVKAAIVEAVAAEAEDDMPFDDASAEQPAMPLAEVVPDWFDELVEWMETEGVATATVARYIGKQFSRENIKASGKSPNNIKAACAPAAVTA